MLNVGSLFSGIGGFDLGFERAGMQVLWQVEIDKAAQSVLRRRFPNTEIHDDVRSVGRHNLKPVDVICGGFPCQDLSVAGKRAGLAGERSGLWFEYHRILSELRPRWVVIENVPGLLSSNRGRDFAVILSGLAELGYLSAWRVLDAQYFGVAQRRRRVFVVASLGDGSAAEILFEREGGGWDTPPGREAGQGAAAVAGTLSANGGGTDRPAGNANELDFCIPALTASGRGVERTGESRGQDPVIPVAFGGNRTSGDIDSAAALNAHGGSGRSDFESETFITFHPRRTNCNPVENICPTQDTGSGGFGAPAIAWHGAQITSPQNQGGVFEEVTPTLNGDPRLMTGVRRLMPVECERLQGFPDGWTDGQSDSARYRQLGNAVCVPVAEWIGRRIVTAKEQ